MKRVLVSILCICLISSSVFADATIVGDVSPTTSPLNWDDTIYAYIGHSGVGSLSINGGSSVDNRKGYIGYNSGSSGAVTVDGEGSVWNIDWTYVGYNGNGTLDISNGATLINGAGYIGYNSGSTGTVTIDGEGSIWNNGNVSVGYDGTGTLDITNGAAVISHDGYIGYESGSTGIATVDGEESVWNSSISYVGYNGTGTLNITNGATFISRYGYIGYGYSYGFCSNGTVTVGGEGSSWNNSESLSVGYNGAGILNITNGGTVSCGNNCYVGHKIGSSGTLNIDGGQLIFNNDDSGELYVGYEGSGTVNIINSEITASETWVGGFGGSGTVNFDNGTLNTESIGAGTDDLAGTGTINTHGIVSDVDLVFDSPSALNQTFTVNKNAGQNITVNLDVDGSGLMGVGYSQAGSLNISNGAAISSTYGYLGYKSGSVGIATVDGEGTSWNNSSNLYVGNFGDGTLEITNGGAVSSNYGYIGNDYSSTGTVTVDGEGSSWNTISSIYVGRYGGGILEITNGGSVSSSYGYGRIGCISGTIGTVAVDGEGSSWNNRGLYVGEYGDGTLEITNGGSVICRDSRLGYYYFSNGAVAVNGEGSVLDNSRSLYVGEYGDGILEITDGATVISHDGYLGYNPRSNGTVNIDGKGSIWNNSDGYLYVGFNGNGRLNISNGATVSSSYGYIGYTCSYGSSSTGTAKVDGGGASWNNSGNLYVGNSGDGTLEITNGGSVISSDGYHIGCNSGVTGKVTVDGADSILSSSDSSYVGFSSIGTLDITNGGTVSNNCGYIGYNSGSAGTVTVDGEGSNWNNRYSLSIGSFGDATLEITNGGAVSSSYGYIGNDYSSTGTVTVDGICSVLSISDCLNVGHYGSGSLKISNGGLVTVGGSLTIDDNEDGDSFVNMSTGGMLALNGSAAGSLQIFLDLIMGTDAINFFNEDTLSWEDITLAAMDVDYTLEYIDDISEDLYGYTILTVGTVPEPATIMLLAIGGLALAKKNWIGAK